MICLELVKILWSLLFRISIHILTFLEKKRTKQEKQQFIMLSNGAEQNKTKKIKAEERKKEIK